MKFYVVEITFGIPVISLSKPEDKKIIGFATSEKEAEEIACSYMERTKMELLHRVHPPLESILEEIEKSHIDTSFMDEFISDKKENEDE